MTKLFTTLFLLFSFQTLAHVKMGVYQGQTPEKEKCFIEIKEKWYVDNFKHPLNERVEVYFDLIQKPSHSYPPPNLFT